MTPLNNQNLGTGGNCICPKCETKVPHRRGVRCQEEKCPECGAKMLREGGYHRTLLQEKRRKKN